MNNAVLLELARRWDNDADESDSQPADAHDPGQQEYDRGVRETLRMCADTLQSLVKLIG